MPITYLDNNATTKPDPAVVGAMRHASEDLWANPSSVHRFGQQVRQQLELSRAEVAQLICAKPRELIFTSGGTESNNLAIQGTSPETFITTRIEHAAIREPADHFDQTVWVDVDDQGRVQPEVLEQAIAEHAKPEDRTLVSIQWANNETGVIQPIEQLVLAARKTAGRVYFHTDATQAVGKIPVDVQAAGVDLLTFSGHKLHGPKGVGVLWRRTGVRLSPVQRGGPQERELRGGTENTAAILGLGVAASLAGGFLDDPGGAARILALRDRFEASILKALPDTVVNSAGAERLWNTSNLGFPGIEAEAILLGLSERGVCASAGAACSSGSLEPSPVLLSMHVPEAVAHGSVRFSLSRHTTDAEIDHAITEVVYVVNRLAKTMPMG